MKGWNEGITNAIAYIEENLTEDIDIKKYLKRPMCQVFTFKKYLMCYVGSRLEST